jgi:hypothetical protein
MPETEAPPVVSPDDGPAVPPDELPPDDDIEMEIEDPEAYEAGIRVAGGHTDDDDEELYEAPGTQTASYEDARAEDERTKLDEFIAKVRQSPGATGKVDIERIGPRSLDEELRGFLDRVDVSDLEDQNVPSWLRDNWGGGVFRLSIRDGLARYRAHVEVRVAGRAKSSDSDKRGGGMEEGIVTILQTMIEKIDSKTNDGGAGDVIKMMELRMAEEREARKEENERREREAKAESDRRERESRERMEQIRADAATAQAAAQAQTQLIVTIMKGQRPETDPLETAIKLTMQQTKGYQELLVMQREAAKISIESAAKVNSSIISHAMATLRSVHDSESDQNFLDKVMGVAGTLAGPAQEALKAIGKGGEPVVTGAPVPAAAPGGVPSPAAATAVEADGPPPPRPDGSLPTRTAPPAIPGPGAVPPETSEAQEEHMRTVAVQGLEIQIKRRTNFVHALHLQLMSDPDPERAWDEMHPIFLELPQAMRDLIEPLAADLPEEDSVEALLPFGQRLLEIFGEGLPPAADDDPEVVQILRTKIEAVQMTVLADIGRAVWLRDFFDAAPWLEDEDEEDLEDDDDDEDPEEDPARPPAVPDAPETPGDPPAEAPEAAGEVVPADEKEED